MSIKFGFIKQGELIEISRIESLDSCLPAVNADILENFKKIAHNLKKVAPKAEDFLYFSAVMMHAAEASGINDDGSPKLNARGEKVEVGWDKSGGTWRWTTNDPSIKPYKNSNGDIFPEEELVKAYKKWQHKPLCIDHKSSSVDHVRGFIVDTYYDRDLKRVIALCALDKAGYPQLARQVSTGVSNCVSMGTAVGKAICTDCARVAKTEADFCDHMRRKSCYGEINVDLNPIELSIVVNGADPKASIKHIIASANTLNSYVESKSRELKKLADSYNAQISFTKDDGKGDSGVTNVSVTSKDLETFRADVSKAIEDFQKLQSSLENEENMQDHTNDTAFSKSPEMNSGSESGLDDLGLAPPHARYASADVEVKDSIADLHKVTAAIGKQLEQMKQSLEKLEKTSTNKQEENMSGSKNINKQGYYQGTEEPTPGQTKYPADPLNEKLRNDGDKHMNGETPFPEVGPVDGLHPGDLERKKLLARAEYEERALKRQSTVDLAKKALQNRLAYFNNGEGPNNPNTPTPGKVKYPADKTNEDLRESGDKHMNGQKPFPGVGSVDGLHPSPSSADVADEKKRKEMLSRAGLKARFVKASNNNGTQDLGKSAWEVYSGDKLLLTASVDDLSGGRVDMNYDVIATKEYGAKLIEKVKIYGSDGVKALVKKAQDAAPMAPTAVPPAPTMEADLAPEDNGSSGDPKEAALKLSEKVRDLSSDLVEAVRALTGEQAEMGEASPDMGATASDGSFNSNSFSAIRKDLNGALTTAMKEAVAELNNSAEELNMINSVYNSGSTATHNQEVFNSLVDDALTEAKSAVADGFRLMTAFVKYARGTQAIVKRAEIEAELDALAEGDSMSGSDLENDSQSGDDLMSLLNDTSADLDDVKDLMSEESDLADDSLEDLSTELNDDDDMSLSMDESDANVEAKKDELKDLGNLPPGSTVTVTAGFDSRAERTIMRSKLAGESGLKYNPVLHDAHPKGGFTTELDVKPEGDLARVEDLEEKHDAMMDVATAPVKVRKEAEAIHKLVSEGKLDAADVDALIAEGLDKDAVSYWKKYYSQADGGSEFASELVKEHVKAELETELNTYKTKIARAFALAYDMADRELCNREPNAIMDQVEKIMAFDNSSFETLKNIVAKHPNKMKKEASGRLPNVGLLGTGSFSVENPVSDYDQLQAMFAKNSRKGSF